MPTLSGPARESLWLNQLYQRASTGPTPFTKWPIAEGGGGGYWLDGDHHYDPLNTFLKVIKYFKRKGLDHTIFLPQVEAALYSWRDLAVLANYPEGKAGNETPGVQGWHSILQGIADHYIEGGYADEADRKAAEILMPTWDGNWISSNESYFHVGLMREQAFNLSRAVDYHRMKTGVHPAVDSLARVNLKMISEVCAADEDKKYGVAFKPFMAGLTAWALIKYWNQYRTDIGRADTIKTIPDAVKRLMNYIYDRAYYKPGSLEGGEAGAVSYCDKNMDDPTMLPRTGKIASVDENRIITVAGLVPGPKDHYKGSNFSADGIADTLLIDGYDPATNRISINKGYYPNYTFQVGQGFRITSVMYQPGQSGRGASGDLNFIVCPGFAWAYWHNKVVLGRDDSETIEFRRRYHEMFNGGILPSNMKQYSQSVFWGVDGLGYAEEADLYVGNPPDFADITGKEIRVNDLVVYTYNSKLELAVVRQTVKGYCKMQVFYTEGDKVSQKDVAIQKAELKVLKITDEESFDSAAHLAAKAYRDKMIV